MANPLRKFRFNLGATRAEAKAVYNDEQWQGSATGMSGVEVYGGQFMSYLNIYKSQPAVRQVIGFIAENMAQVPIALYKRVDDDQRESVSDHEVARTLQSPNPETSPAEFMRDFVTDLELFDVAFYRKQYVDDELHVTRLFPDAVTLHDFDNLGPRTFRVRKLDGSVVDLKRDEVIYVHGYGDARGISRMETLKGILSEDVAASEYREGLYKNGMRNAGVIERPLDAPAFSETARNRFRTQIEERHTGAGASGRPLLLEEGMTWKSDQISMRSEEYIAGRELATRTVANTYNISPAMLGLTDAPYASITEYNRQLYRNALASRMTFITQALERQLLTRGERVDEKLYIEFNLEAKLRGSFLEQAQIAATAVGEPWMTVNEWRAKMDMPPLEEKEAARFADVGLPALVAGGIVSPAWAASQIGAPTEGMSTVPTVVGMEVPAEEEVPSGEAPGPDPTGAAVDDQPAPSEDAPKSSSWKDVKAAQTTRRVINRRDEHAKAIEEVLLKTFVRMEAAAKSQRYAKARFERELAEDLEPVLSSIVVAEGSRKAEQLGEDFDRKFTVNYVKAAAENTARNVAQFADDARKRHTNDEGTVDHALLGTALAGMATKVGKGMATNLVSFARESAGKQAGVLNKTWIVTSENSRHTDVDGETVKLGETFSNGLSYPGDPSGDPEETAHCQCVLDVGSA